MWIIGDGKEVLAWEHNWIPGVKEVQRNRLRGFHQCPYRLVENFIDQDTKQWNVMRVLQWWPNEIARKNLTIKINEGKDDELVWEHSKYGDYEVKRAYEMMEEDGQVENEGQVYLNIWRLQLPQKIKFFLWQCLTEALPTSERLHKHSFYTNQVWLTRCKLHQNNQRNSFHT